MNSPQSSHVATNIARQKRFWTRQATSWDHNAENNPGLVKVVEAVLSEAAPSTTMTVVDLGCGSGQLTLRLAPHVKSIHAIDISQSMIELLEKNAAARNIQNVSASASPIEYLNIDPASVDLVVSNYVLHHLRDEDKAKTVLRATEWLRPGGRLVIGDMMFGRGADPRDREIISSKLHILLKKGPGGWWRIAKNSGRYVFRFQERPVSMQTWARYLRDAGLIDVRSIPVVQEGAVVSGTKPTHGVLH